MNMTHEDLFIAPAIDATYHICIYNKLDAAASLMGSKSEDEEWIQQEVEFISCY